MASYDNKVLKGDQLLVYTQKVKEAIGTKQNKIDSSNKLAYELISGTPTIPTNNNQLTNGAGYQTANDVETTISGKGYQTSSEVESAITGKGYQTATEVQSAITAAIGDIGSFKFEVVETLPASGQKTNVIYLLPKNPGTTDNIYTEYAWIDSKWEILGDTSVSLDFLTNAEIGQIWTDAQ